MAKGNAAKKSYKKASILKHSGQASYHTPDELVNKQSDASGVCTSDSSYNNELTSGSSYSKRKLLSNWERYGDDDLEERENGSDDDEGSAKDYNHILQNKAGYTSHFQFQEEKEWQEDLIGENNNDAKDTLLNINLNLLASDIASFSTYEKLQLNQLDGHYQYCVEELNLHQNDSTVSKTSDSERQSIKNIENNDTTLYSNSTIKYDDHIEHFDSKDDLDNLLAPKINIFCNRICSDNTTDTLCNDRSLSAQQCSSIEDINTVAIKESNNTPVIGIKSAANIIPSPLVESMPTITNNVTDELETKNITDELDLDILLESDAEIKGLKRSTSMQQPVDKVGIQQPLCKVDELDDWLDEMLN